MRIVGLVTAGGVLRFGNGRRAAGRPGWRAGARAGDALIAHSEQSLKDRAGVAPGRRAALLSGGRREAGMLTGGCKCGGVRYETGAAPFNPTLCHCLDCRRATGAPAVAWFSVRRGALRFTRGAPKRYASSARAERAFCPDCGTPLLYEGRDYPDDTDIATATLDDPEAVPPADHVWTRSRVSWLPIADGKPAYATTRSAGRSAG